VEVRTAEETVEELLCNIIKIVEPIIKHQAHASFL
jgi:hypothetical protein